MEYDALKDQISTLEDRVQEERKLRLVLQTENDEFQRKLNEGSPISDEKSERLAVASEDVDWEGNRVRNVLSILKDKGIEKEFLKVGRASRLTNYIKSDVADEFRVMGLTEWKSRSAEGDKYSLTKIGSLVLDQLLEL